MLKFLNERGLSTSQIINEEIFQQYSFRPICKENITLVVSIILLNDRNEICLIQEAKKECQTKWYVPAGRVESNETLVDAAKREAKEETGYEVEPIHLSLIEINANCTWLRFTFIAIIVSGSLKTIDQADKESIQAAWFALDLIEKPEFAKNLRSIDFFSLAKVAVECYQRLAFDSFSETNNLHSNSLPISLPIENIQFSFVLINPSKKSLLLSLQKCLPSLIFVPKNDIHNSIEYVLSEFVETKCFHLGQKLKFVIKGVLSVKYDGHFKDGIEITFLTHVLSESEIKINDKFVWQRLNDECLMQHSNNNFQLIHLHTPV